MHVPPPHPNPNPSLPIMHTQVYHLPIEEAAAALSIGTTVLKKFCRKFSVGRWPYRKLSSIDKLIEIVRADAKDNPEMMAVGEERGDCGERGGCWTQLVLVMGITGPAVSISDGLGVYVFKTLIA